MNTTTDNQTINSILSRTSVRIYDTERKVDRATVDTLLHAAMAAPSAVNKQPWEFIVVDRRDLLDRLADALPYAKMLSKAPLAIVICGNKSRFLPGTDDSLWVQDLSAASENLLIAATALGLGAVWTCVYPHAERENPVHDILDIPDEIVPLNIIPIGYPAHTPKPHDKWEPSRVHFNKWDGK